MKRLFILSILLQLVVLYPIQAQSQEKAREILSQANTTIGNINDLAYEYVYKGTGKFVGYFTGSAKLSGDFPAFYFWVDLKTRNASGSVIKEEMIYAHRNDLKLVDHTNQVVKEGTFIGGSRYLTAYAYYAVLFQYIMPQPFQAELSDETLTYEGTEVVNGVECHVISTKSQIEDRVYWYIGKKDYLIHAQKTTNNRPDEEGEFFFTMSKLQVDSGLEPADFELPSPDGYQVSNEDRRIVAVGEKAPNWTFNMGSGNSIRNTDFLGKVVVLDFWSAWCLSCRTYMPVVNQARKDFNGQNVQFLSINSWESPELDIQKYLERRDLRGYQALVDPDGSISKHFKLFSIPLVVVIGKQGTIVYMTEQIGDNFEQDFRNGLQKALKN